jgi:hypothetical protein
MPCPLAASDELKSTPGSSSGRNPRRLRDGPVLHARGAGYDQRQHELCAARDRSRAHVSTLCASSQATSTICRSTGVPRFSGHRDRAAGARAGRWPGRSCRCRAGRGTPRSPGGGEVEYAEAADGLAFEASDVVEVELLQARVRGRGHPACAKARRSPISRTVRGGYRHGLAARERYRGSVRGGPRSAARRSGTRRRPGYPYVTVDGTLAPINRGAAGRPFYSGKHRRHGMNLQVSATYRRHPVGVRRRDPGRFATWPHLVLLNLRRTRTPHVPRELDSEGSLPPRHGMLPSCDR